jgi:hypothetical protein
MSQPSKPTLYRKPVSRQPSFSESTSAPPDDYCGPDELFSLGNGGLMNGKSIGFLRLKSHTPTSHEIAATPVLATVTRVIDEWLFRPCAGSQQIPFIGIEKKSWPFCVRPDGQEQAAATQEKWPAYQEEEGRVPGDGPFRQPGAATSCSRVWVYALQLCYSLLDRRGSRWVILKQSIELCASLLDFTSSPKTGGSTDTAAKSHFILTGLSVIVSQDQFQVCGGQEMSRSADALACHFGQHASLDFAGLDRDEHIAYLCLHRGHAFLLTLLGTPAVP